MGSGARYALQEALLWASLALAGIAALYFHEDIASALLGASNRGAFGEARDETADRPETKPSGFAREVTIRADERGHFVLQAAINDRPVTVMADTGASLVVLTYEDATRAGLAPRSLDFSGRVQTANGTARVAPITLAKVRIADITLRNVSAAVAERGALPVNLLGMSVLGRLKRFEMRGRELILEQ